MASDVKCDKCGNMFPFKSVLLGYAVEVKSNCYICPSCNEVLKKENAEKNEKSETKSGVDEKENEFINNIKLGFYSFIKSKHIAAALVCDIFSLLTLPLFVYGQAFVVCALILSIIAMSKDYVITGVISFVLSFFLYIYSMQIFIEKQYLESLKGFNEALQNLF